MDVQHLAGRQTVGVGGKRLERGEIGIAGAKGFQIGAMVMRFGVVGLEGQRLLVTCRRLVELALLLQRVAQVVVRSVWRERACHCGLVELVLPEMPRL